MNAIHNPKAGEILKDMLDEYEMSQNKIAKNIKVPVNRINSIVRGERKITVDTDLRLCKFFNLSDGYFLRLQMGYELMEAAKNKRLIDIIKSIEPIVK